MKYYVKVWKTKADHANLANEQEYEFKTAMKVEKFMADQIKEGIYAAEIGSIENEIHEPQAWYNAEEVQVQIKCIVACRNSSGLPDFFPCLINCSQHSVNIGDHYQYAMQMADNNYYDKPMIVYSENDKVDFLFKQYQSEFKTLEKVASFS